jgi:hypothetical protein
MDGRLDLRAIGDHMTLPDDDRWRETADAETRRQHPVGYWCVRDDEGVRCFWHELTVTRDEYLAHSGKGDCAAA